MAFAAASKAYYSHLQFSKLMPGEAGPAGELHQGCPPPPPKDSIVSLMRAGAGGSVGVATSTLQGRQRELRKLMQGSRRRPSVKRSNSNSSSGSRSGSFKMKKNNKGKSKPTMKKKVTFAIPDTKPAAAAASPPQQQQQRGHQDQGQGKGHGSKSGSGGLDLLVQVVLQNEFTNLKCTEDNDTAASADETKMDIEDEKSGTTPPPHSPPAAASTGVNLIQIPTPPACATTTKTTNEDGDDWLEYFNVLVDYKDSKGTYDVPPNYIDPNTGLHLGEWVMKQRHDLSELYQSRRRGGGVSDVDWSEMPSSSFPSVETLRRVQALKRIGFHAPEEEQEQGAIFQSGPPTLDDWDKGFLKFIVSDTPYKKNARKMKKKATSAGAVAAAEPAEREAWIEKQRYQYNRATAADGICMMSSSSQSSSQSQATTMATSAATDTAHDVVDLGDIYSAVQARFRFNLLKQLGVDLDDNNN